MNKANKKITCPRCHSHKLYKFGKDKEGNQKYQCKDCKRQFAPWATPKERQLKDYPCVQSVTKEPLFIIIVQIILTIVVTIRNVIIVFLCRSLRL